MALHEQAVGATDEWYTPPHVFEAMGVRFDMDVSHPGRGLAGWIPAEHYMTHGGLTRPWSGFLWMNAPFGRRNGLEPWLARFFGHGDGVALTPDRTSAPWWQDYAPKADAILFVRKKLRFIKPDGTEGASPAQGTTLMAAGPRGVAALQNAAKAGLGFLIQGPAPVDVRLAGEEGSSPSQPSGVGPSDLTGPQSQHDDGEE